MWDLRIASHREVECESQIFSQRPVKVSKRRSQQNRRAIGLSRLSNANVFLVLFFLPSSYAYVHIAIVGTTTKGGGSDVTSMLIARRKRKVPMNQSDKRASKKKFQVQLSAFKLGLLLLCWYLTSWVSNSW